MVPAARLSLTLLVCFALFGLLLAGCAGRSPNRVAVEVVEVLATSETSVTVTFSGPVGAGAGTASNFQITGPGGISDQLGVIAAYPTADGLSVNLATEPQRQVIYNLEVSNVNGATGGASPSLSTSASAFGGSSERAPILASAISLSNTTVLLTYATPPPGQPEQMDSSAENIAYYDITEPDPKFNKTPDLTILGAESMNGGTMVVLTTEPQSDVLYEVKVTNVTSKAGGKLIDPTNNTATFNGIPEFDDVAPFIVKVEATSNTTVLISFSEPVTRDAANAELYQIVDEDGNPLPIESAVLQSFDTQVLLTTLPQRDETVEYTLTVRDIQDLAENFIDPNPATATFSGISRRGPIDGDTVPPRVSNTGSTGNKTVVVNFSEPVLGGDDNAENPAHYRIVGAQPLSTQGLDPQIASLPVISAALSASRTSVVLTTGPQSAIEYKLSVTNVKDLAGNQIAPAEFGVPTPSTVLFFGTPPDVGDLVDSDGDGLTDDEELLGWVVRVERTNGSTDTFEVTSDPNEADTDGDGVGDATEKAVGSNPRNPDTDDDLLTDYQELNEIYSSQNDQDTDDDSLSDSLEWNFFKTSPLFADTDGDQFTDDEEVVTQNRNPLIADMPEFAIDVVGDVNLGLDVRFTATNENGSRFLETRNSQTSLSSSASRTRQSSNSKSTEWFINAGAKVGFTYKPLANWTFNGEFSIQGGYKEGTSTSFSNQSVTATQREQTRSLSTDKERSVGESVTREVVGASMAAAIELQNLGDVAITIENLELLAKTVDPRDPTRFIPVATLTATTDRITLGPAPDARGPMRFTADNPSPSLIEQLRQNPTNLIFEVANYDIVDENGRNFGFTLQDVNDRTATLLIDYAGRLPDELNRVATHSGFTLEGSSIGVTMQTVLEEILGLEFVPEAEDDLLTSCLIGTSTSLCSEEDRVRIKNSYSTRPNGAGLIELSRVRNVANDPDNGYRWFFDFSALPSDVPIPNDFNELVARSGTFFTFLYGQDLDGDGLTVQQEAFYGSLDSEVDALNNACFGDPTHGNCDDPDDIPDSRDTDRDGISDDQEVFGQKAGLTYEPWLVVVQGQDAYTTSSSPSRYDTDFDGLTDCQELGQCDIFLYIYPDDSTDAPGAGQAALRTALEADRQNGSVVGLFLDDTGRPTLHPTINPAWTIQVAPNTDPSTFDTDGDGLSDPLEVQGARYFPLDAVLGDQPVQLVPEDPPGYATNPLDLDSDGDILGDGFEVQIGSDPTDPSSTQDAAFDNDGDGLRNIEEEAGWVVVYRNLSGKWVDTNGDFLKVDASDNPLDAAGNPVALDASGNPLDYRALVLPLGDLPARVSSDKNSVDTDLDGLSDAEERALHTDPTRRDTDGDGLTDAEEIAGVDFPPDAGDPVRFTNVLNADTDADSRSDGIEATDSWTVVVTGETPYKTFSDPLTGDRDLDGLTDTEERALLSDPNLFDTDGDGVDDKGEADSIYSRNPLVPDQVVEFNYENATMLNTCYQIPGEESFEGWTLSFSEAFAKPFYNAFGGNPGGYIWPAAIAFVNNPTISFNAPADFLGNKSAYYDGTLSFDLREYVKDALQTRFTPNVAIYGGNGVVVLKPGTKHESTAWTTVDVSLSETGWIFIQPPAGKTTTDTVTDTDFKAVLSNVLLLAVNGTYELPNDNSFFGLNVTSVFAGLGFDNPTLSKAGQDTITTAFDSGQLTSGNFQGNFNFEFPDSTGLSVTTVATANSVISRSAQGGTVPFPDDPQRFVVGRDQGFRVFSSNIFEESESYTLGLDDEDIADYGNFSFSYDYPLFGGSEVATLRGERFDGTDNCELSVSWSWRVLE